MLLQLCTNININSQEEEESYNFAFVFFNDENLISLQLLLPTSHFIWSVNRKLKKGEKKRTRYCFLSVHYSLFTSPSFKINVKFLSLNAVYQISSHFLNEFPKILIPLFSKFSPSVIFSTFLHRFNPFLSFLFHFLIVYVTF